MLQENPEQAARERTKIKNLDLVKKVESYKFKALELKLKKGVLTKSMEIGLENLEANLKESKEVHKF